ncbi:sensor domain-containing diguanylate cyclase [Dyella acidiphila]|uniref:Diguanylate cyclase n=1 Tax=Dyella acidiphila TaxID=2775866 RepID=A0ABR9GDU2_9GAMM|nr:sensor domain-containing diguanylate cyclase [Dyella acidiphila]MBE1162208.1 diguanylate cyclase [Dyella acidiphila]
MVFRRYPDMLWHCIGLFALAGGVSLYSIALARATHSPTSLWLANGIMLGLLVRRPLAETWPLLMAGFLGFVTAKQILGDPLLTTLALGLCHAGEALLVSVAIRRRFPVIGPQTRFLALARVGLISAFIGCGLCALAIAAMQHFWPAREFFTSFNTLFRSHFLGMVIAGSTSLVVVTKDWRRSEPGGTPWRLIRDLLLMAVIACVVFSVSRVPLLFLVYPPLLLLVFRHRFAGMVIGLAIIALITTATTMLNIGPFNLVAGTTAAMRVVMAQVFIGASCLVALPVVLALAEQDRLQARVRESELRYRMLADNSGDLVMRIRPNGDRQYVSPSVKELLGWEVDDFMHPRPDLIHPDDRQRITQVVTELRAQGGAVTATYRLQHKRGHYLWIEAFARLVASPDDDGSMEIIYTGRDVTARVLAEQALMESQAQLQTIADNVPAVIARIDMSEHYTYVNRFVEQVSGESPEAMVGKTIKEVRGNRLYEQLKSYLRRAYAGESVMFEYEANYRGHLLQFQAHYVPDRGADGRVRGLYALTTEITHIKNVERELLRLAHQDSLTGLANRRYFHERVSLVLRQAAQFNMPVLLALVDIDNFKSINDSHGHATGDMVLAEVGQCLQRLVREGEMVARIGGDEFVVLCSDIGTEDNAQAFLHSLWERLHMAVAVGTGTVEVRMSIGAAMCHGTVSVDVLMKLADEALYAAKEAGRDTYRLLIRNLHSSESAAEAIYKPGQSGL